jgi:hypothetical protein
MLTLLENHIVSYGAGTNSTAMLVGLWERGERPEAITFADTGGEKPHTYRHLSEVNAWCLRVGLPEIQVLGPVMPKQKEDGTLENECLRLGKLPAKAYGFSSCSDKWKMEPQKRFNALFSETKGIRLNEITRLIGFDADEPGRVARGREMAAKKPVREAYPLFDWGWGREECVAAIKRAGLPQPGKSACFFCPSSKKAEVIQLAKDYPVLFDRAVLMERRALQGAGPAPATMSKGLGRGFSWESLVAGEVALSEHGMPEVDCGCYDGE